MKKLILPAGAALAAAAPAAATAAISLDGVGAKPPTAAHAHAYELAYGQVARTLGRRTPGRNIIREGIANHVPATDAETLASLRVLKRMLATASYAHSSNSATSTSTVAPAPVASTGGAGVPACASESGSNYSTGASNTNSSSGATGRYQILPSTASAYGCDLSTAAGQDACAQTIYAHQGASAWVGCGG